jgi:uncharacterized damage-inducible protein DinB
MCDDIMRSVAGCRLSHTHAVLRNYRRYAVKGEVYPALIASEGGLVKGIVYHDTPDTAWLRLDRFEGEMYARRFVNVVLADGRAETVYAYIIRPEFEGRIESTEWDFEAFLQRGKTRFETEYPGYGALKHGGKMMSDKSDLLDGLRRAPSVLSAFVRSMPENKLDLRRGQGFWTIAEHISHLAQVQPMLLERIQRFMKEDHPEFVPYIPGEGADEPVTPVRMEVSAALEQFADCRKNLLADLERADQSAWQKMAAHPEYEHYSLYILVRHILMHDFWHMYRMEELWLTRDAYLTRME